MSTKTASPEARKRRPVLKWSLITLGAVLALLVLLLLALRFAAQSEFGRQFAEKRIEAADPSGQDIEIYGLSGDLLGTFRIDRLTIADDEGIWLVAENVLADWKPLALRKRALLIEALEADLIHVRRRPNIVSSGSSSGGGSMPLRAGELARLRIGELRTDEGVLPRALRLEINGLGRVGQDGGRTELSVQPLEGTGDSLAADLTWSRDLRLEGTLELDGPAGGLFATLARLEPVQSLSAGLTADGTLDDWSGEAEVSIDGETALAAKAANRGDAITFGLTAHPRRHPMSRAVADTLGDTLTVEGRLLSDEGRQMLLDLTANAEGLELRAEAGPPQDGAYSADIRLTADQPSRYAGNDSISVGQAILDGILVYDEGAARFDGDIEASDVDVPSFAAKAVSGPLSAVYDSPSITVRTTLTGRGAALPGMAGQIAGAQPSVQMNALYSLDARSLALRETIVRGKAGRVSAAGTLQFSPGFSANLAGSFNLDGAEAGLARPVRLNGQFQANRSGAGRTGFTLSSQAMNFGSLPAPLDQWSDGRASLNARGELVTDGSVRLSSLSLRSGTLQLEGSGRYSSDGRLYADTSLGAGEAMIGGLTLESVTGQTVISGPLSGLEFETRLNAPSLSGSGISFSDITLLASGRYGDGKLDAGADLEAGTSNGPLAASTGLSLDGSRWQLNGFGGRWGDLDATADLSGQGGNIGAVRGSLDIIGDLPEGLPAQRIVADAQIEGERVVLDASLETVAFGPTRADALILRANGTPDDITFIAEMEGRTELNALTYETAFNLDGTLQGLASGQLDLTASVAAILGDIGFVTEEPIHYTRHDDGFEAGAKFAALGGTLTSGITTRGETSIRLQGENLKIAPLLVIAGRPGLTGAMNIGVALDEVEGGLAGPMSVELKSVARPGSDLPPVDLIISGDLAPGELVTSIRAGDNENLEAAWDITVPVRTMDTMPFIQLREGADIPFKAAVDGQIEAVSALIVPPNMVLRGIVDLDLSGRLPHLNESFNGRLDFSEGKFEHGDLGMVLNEIKAAAALGGGSVELTELSARGRSGGTLSGRGSMAIDGSARSDVKIEARQLVVTERREGRATVSGTMELRQQPDLLEIIGDLTVDKGELNIENLPTGGPPTLDVNFSEPADTSEAEEEEEEAATRLDIKLKAPGRIDVRGRGVNAELAMDADISGSIGKPVITGSASIVRGRFDLIGKRFQFTDSTLRLAPDIGSSPLDISASHETRDDIIAILNVDGTIDRPEVTLTSEPVLPEDEVLSRVLFGRSPTQLSGLEAARLAAALAQLSGGGGFDLLGGIERALGLDTFDVGSGSNGDVQVTSGKYLTEDVYLEVRSSATGAPGVAIEWEPVTNIELEAATSTEDGQQVSIQWKRDFDDGVFPGISGNRTGPGNGSNGQAAESAHDDADQAEPTE